MKRRVLGPYEILGPAGAGGMGEVYRARDTRLDRNVALKVLPSRFADSPQRRRRLEREARAISRLSHPNICTLHDIGHDDGVDFLVMEYLEGETLADRIGKGRLEWRPALELAVELAGALDAAHREGIVHRDLKPGNVMLTRTGPKILDFGLAKLDAAGPVSPDDETRAPPLTEERAVLGTPRYMAPEQLQGLEVDARADIWALGLTIHEMIGGARAFDATSQGGPPPLSTPELGAPEALDRLLRKCLARDPAERWQSARDLLYELTWIRDADASPATPAVVRRTFSGERLVWTGVVLALAAVVAVVALRPTGGTAGRRPPARFTVTPPSGVEVFSSRISPDGRYVSISGFDGNQTRIWLRPRNELTSRPIAGTEGARYWHFWSPDSRYIAFFADGELRRVGLDGGPEVTLSNAPGTGPIQSGTWSPDGTILFDVLEMPGRDGLHRISAGGGEATRLTILDEDGQELRALFPSFLSDGRHFTCVGVRMGGESPFVPIGTYLVSLDSLRAVKLMDDPSNTWYVDPGHLIYVRQGTLLVDTLGLDTGRLAGDPIRLAGGVQMFAGVGVPNFSASADGVLAYTSVGAQSSRLQWRDRGGKVLGDIGRPAAYDGPRLSPDDRNLVVTVADPVTSTSDLWLIDLERDVVTRFTSEGLTAHASVWSPDRERIAFAMPRGASPFMHAQRVGGGEPTVLLPSTGTVQWPWDWPTDGLLVFGDRSPETNWDLWTLSPDDGRAEVFLRTPYREYGARVSPDGRWIAYLSDESGTEEVYVQSFPVAGAKRRVSTDGGRMAEWRADGSELFYVKDKALMAVPILPGDGLSTGAPVELFRDARLIDYDVTADGQRFVVNTAEDETPGGSTVVLLDWAAAVR